ncbi:MAG: hypothetical protein H6607_03590 [Flavobacteriales bacterium]|nr:hypothetical protein [Flavobacteriales bacterium]
MTATDIISFVESPEKLGHEQFLSIVEFQKKYPWFSTLHTLEARCLKNEKKFTLKKALKKASLFAGNREVLYAFLHDEKQKSLQSVTTEKETVSAISEPKTVDAADVLVETVEEILPEIPMEEIITPIEESVVEIAVPKVDTPESIEKENPKKPVVTPVYDPLIELQKFVKGDTNESKVVKNIPLDETPTPKPKPTNEKHGFLDWLSELDAPEETKKPKPRPLIISDEAKELLENFIKNRPQKAKIRINLDKTEIAKSYENQIVTESLADLHLKQKRPDLALDIYEKLRLQIPEKMAYFAALIEKIRKEHNLE